MNKWRKLWRLSWGERWFLIEALWLLPLTALAVRLVGLRRWHLALARLAPVKTWQTNKLADPTLLSQAKATAHVVRAAARHGFHRANCLQQSLSLWWLLQRQGIQSELRIGVCKHAGEFEAHAWVELAGVALNETYDSQRIYVPFERSIIPLAVNS